MPQQRTYTVYKFDELSDDAQKKALDKLRYANVESPYWYTSVTENAKDCLKERGFENAEIFFTGFASQGDGASFTCKLNIAQWFESVPMNKQVFPAAYAEAVAGNVYGNITKSGHYEHEMTMAININYDGSNEYAEKELATIEAELLEEARKEARSIYRDLESEHDMLTEDAQVKEMIYANDYDFTESGDID